MIFHGAANPHVARVLDRGSGMGQKLDGAVGKAARLIESVLKSLGLDPDKNRTQAAEGVASWQVSRGSADVLIAISPGPAGRAPRLRVVSPLVKMHGGLAAPAAIKLLRLNATELPGIAFGLFRDDIVALVAERSVADLDRAEVEDLLAAIGHLADEFDDLLVKEFGGTRVCDLG
jgi:hypothetical protein